jgi:ribosomal protein S27E
MRASCLKCNAITLHVRTDGDEVVCSICGRVLIELW